MEMHVAQFLTRKGGNAVPKVIDYLMYPKRLEPPIRMCKFKQWHDGLWKPKLGAFCLWFDH